MAEKKKITPKAADSDKTQGKTSAAGVQKKSLKAGKKVSLKAGKKVSLKAGQH